MPSLWTWPKSASFATSAALPPILACSPEQIRIEITEREELVSATAKSNMQALSVLGYRFLIDDFGTAARISPTSPNRRFEESRSIACSWPLSTRTPLRPVLPGMYRIARELGLDVIAEGVETEEQDLLLYRIAPDAIGQGWHYGRPLNKRRSGRHPGWVALPRGWTQACSLALDLRPSKMSVRPMDATIVKLSAMALTPVGAAEPTG